MSGGPKTESENSPEITLEMIDAGASVILGAVGGADLGGYFSAPKLASEVFRAMAQKASFPRKNAP